MNNKLPLPELCQAYREAFTGETIELAGFLNRTDLTPNTRDRAQRAINALGDLCIALAKEIELFRSLEAHQ